ncbi:MAG: PRC-barrel domain-containing protein [Gemmatimonadota bacterium]
MPAARRVNLRDYAGDPATLRSNWFQIRDWTVRTLVDNVRAGTIHGLLLDDQNIPRYLDVALNRPSRHVLVPIGQARANRGHQLIWLPGFAEPQFAAIPSYGHEPLTRGDEARLLSAYGGTMAGAERRQGYRVLGGRERCRLKPQDPRRLVPLTQLPSMRVAVGVVDPRGWSVVDRAGAVLGAVTDLLIDLSAGKARYLICELAVEDAELRRVLVPVEFVRLDKSTHVGALPSFSPELLSALDTFDGRPPEPEREMLILERFAEVQASEEFYRHPRFDPTSFFGAA